MLTTDGRGGSLAFGLHLTAAFDAPGLAPATTDLGRHRETALEIVADASLETAFTSADVDLLADDDFGGARFAVWRHSRLGILIYHDYFGRFRISADGTSVVCAPRPMENWMWQRFLVGQLLPTAALLHGLEPMHASAVAVGGRAILLLGASGAGKTSVALHAVDAGAGFVTDDVAAIELSHGQPYVHPGAALSNADPHELARLDARSTEGWEVLGSIDGEVRVRLADTEATPLAVSDVFVLTRERDVREILVDTADVDWAPALLGAGFNPFIDESGRSVRWLEVCGSLADRASLHHVVAPLQGSAALVARVVLDCAAR